MISYWVTHCPMVSKYFWHSLLISMRRKRNCALLKSKMRVEWKENPLKIVFYGTAILWLLNPFHILFNSFSQIHFSLKTDTAMEWFLARTALKVLWTENKIMFSTIQCHMICDCRWDTGRPCAHTTFPNVLFNPCRRNYTHRHTHTCTHTPCML